MKPTKFPRKLKWVFSGGGYGNDNRRRHRLERRARDREAAQEIKESARD